MKKILGFIVGLVMSGVALADPSSVYMNGLGYYDSRDPQSQEATIQAFVISNFNLHNRVQWENTASHNLFTLIRIDNAVVDDKGVIVDGDLIWEQQVFAAISEKKHHEHVHHKF